jgi:DNA polymerase III epsilon subunit-like protein
MTLFLDIETTGRSAADRIVEIGVVDDDGETVFWSLVNPGIPISAEVTAIHGITDQMVRDAPTFAAIETRLRETLAADGTVVIYNADFDRRFFPGGFWDDLDVQCAMHRYSVASGRRSKLKRAAKMAGYTESKMAHRAVADAQACRAVWRWLDQHGAAAPDRFANLDATELARQAWEAYRRAEEAAAELKQYKAALVKMAGGEKQVIAIPGVCRVMVSAPVDTTGRRPYRFAKDAFEMLDEDLRQTLLDLGVVKISDKIGTYYAAVRFIDQGNEVTTDPNPTKQGTSLVS